jgi:hypothetical protein
MTKFPCALVLSLALLFLSFAFAAGVAAQKEEKSWTRWSKKDAENMLNNSPWAQTQTDTDSAEMFFSPTSDPRLGRGTANDQSRLESGASNQSLNVKYNVRFFSARPVRRALMRMIQLQQKDLEPDVIERMNNFADLPSTDSIIIAVTIESSDKRSLGKVMQIVNSAATGTLKNKTYLERNDGKRLFLEEYLPPGKDGFGARFIFPRLVDEQPFLTSESSEVRFVSEFDRSVKLNTTFKLASMMLDGKLEY